MSARSRSAAAPNPMRKEVALVVLFGLGLGSARADSDESRRAAVAVRVGERAITVGEIEDRMAEVPAFQLRTFGATDAEIRRAFVEQAIVSDALWAAGASARHIDRSVPRTRFDLDCARAQAMLAALRRGIGGAEKVSMEDVQAYYDKNRPRYDAPERTKLWRISCATKAEAETVLADVKHDPTIVHWNKLPAMTASTRRPIDAAATSGSSPSTARRTRRG